MTAEEFFEWQLEQDGRFELVNGFPVKMMAGASNLHDRIVTNVLFAFHSKLRGTGCRELTADVAVRTRIKSIRRADITVTCDAVARADSYEAGDPKLIVEVLSPSNSGIEWQRKLEEYRRHPTLSYILLVDSKLPRATLLKRIDTVWEASDLDSLDGAFELPAIGTQLTMAEIYDDVVFPPRPRHDNDDRA